jgi:DNA-binding CsgD family transcriptional regulator
MLPHGFRVTRGSSDGSQLPEELMTPRALWHGLLDGRWSIVGRYEEDERQILVARRNDSPVTASRLLTERERQIVELAAAAKSNKQIAYDVGLSTGSVSGYLTTALRKMGIRARAELVVLVACGAAEPGEGSVRPGASRAPYVTGPRASGRST